jgi:hypothetical protein
MSDLLKRLSTIFLEPADATPLPPAAAERATPGFAPHSALPGVAPPAGAEPALHGFAPPATPPAFSAPVSATPGRTERGARGDSTPAAIVVLGAAPAAIAVAAAAGGELRARSRAAAALVCLWRPPGAPLPPPETDAPAARSPAGATTPGARKLAARLTAQGLPATACGRLAWLVLDATPADAADQVERCDGFVAEPRVLAIAGARPEALEPLLARAALCVAVLPVGTDPALAELASASLPPGRGVVLPPLALGPPRWAALAGLARLRTLPEVPR